MSYKVAVVGATGNVGREMLNVLAERAFPVSEVVALASTRSVGKDISFGDKTLKVKALDYYDFPTRRSSDLKQKTAYDCVTGVQTCALPISRRSSDLKQKTAYDCVTGVQTCSSDQIGRASCRERV